MVIGGGAAGMMAAIATSDMGAKVTLCEKNEKLGKKVYITGKGRCNVTNDSDVDNLLRNVISNPKFLYSAFYTFDSSRVISFLEDEGLRLKTERGNRVFPVSDKSSDVIFTLQNSMKKRNVDIIFHAEVKDIQIENCEVKGVNVVIGKKDKKFIKADSVIIATGGCSYPSTGSTGDGYEMAKESGHKIKECTPSLVPFNIKEEFAKELQGLSLKNIRLKLTDGRKVLYEEMGEMLFTHFGISGPLVLTASCYASGKNFSNMKISLDLKPALNEKQLDERILRDFEECKNSMFKNSLGKLLPNKMIKVIVNLSGINPEKKVNEVTREEREGLVKLLKNMELTPTGLRGFGEAIITKGGVSVKDINPATMESKLIRGMYFAGEVIDLDAVTGGYNLQIAWSTGYLAGMSSASDF